VSDTKALLSVSGKDSIDTLLNMVGRVGHHVSILVQGHHDESFDLFAAVELNGLLDTMIKVLLHVAVSERRPWEGRPNGTYVPMSVGQHPRRLRAACRPFGIEIDRRGQSLSHNGRHKV
jgi:hypothetical protein